MVFKKIFDSRHTNININKCAFRKSIYIVCFGKVRQYTVCSVCFQKAATLHRNTQNNIRQRSEKDYMSNWNGPSNQFYGQYSFWLTGPLLISHDKPLISIQTELVALFWQLNSVAFNSLRSQTKISVSKWSLHPSDQTPSLDTFCKCVFFLSFFRQ